MLECFLNKEDPDYDGKFWNEILNWHNLSSTGVSEEIPHWSCLAEPEIIFCLLFATFSPSLPK